MEHTHNNMRSKMKILQSQLDMLRGVTQHVNYGAPRPKSILKLKKRRINLYKPYLSIRHHILPKTQESSINDALKKSIPIISNMPRINSNLSAVLINTSPFALTDRRFGILHHDSPNSSKSYFQ